LFSGARRRRDCWQSHPRAGGRQRRARDERSAGSAIPAMATNSTTRCSNSAMPQNASPLTRDAATRLASQEDNRAEMRNATRPRRRKACQSFSEIRMVRSIGRQLARKVAKAAAWSSAAHPSSEFQSMGSSAQGPHRGYANRCLYMCARLRARPYSP
jgi:hypothetical protein